MKIVDEHQQIEIINRNWPLAEQLFAKWGMAPDLNNEIKVVNVNDISPELSAWGIPWRYL